MPWKGWQPSRGIRGRLRVEWVAGLLWNQWQDWRGIRTAFGFAWELDKNGFYFFYADALDSRGSLLVTPRNFLTGLNHVYPENGYRPEWTVILCREMNYAVADDDLDIHLILHELGIGHEEIFRGMLDKPANKGTYAIDEIRVSGVYMHEPLSPGSLDGWVSRIRRDGTRKVGIRGVSENLDAVWRAMTGLDMEVAR